MEEKYLLNNILQRKALDWIKLEKTNKLSPVNSLVSYIENKNKLRQPQFEAIKIYLFIKIKCNNDTLFNIIRNGVLYEKEQLDDYPEIDSFNNDYILKFLYVFGKTYNCKNMCTELLRTKNQTEKWYNKLQEIINDFGYSNYLYNLPMGAGKTFLIAAFIYIDLYFALLNKEDKRFAHNFIVLAPTASKTAILPSLKTIQKFPISWIFSANEEKILKKIIKFEILDVPNKNTDKLNTNNTNLIKASRLINSRNFGLVFITNAEKVIMMDSDKSLNSEIDTKENSKILNSIELRDKLSTLNNFMLILDEVHHAYSKDISKIKRLKTREAISFLNSKNNLNSVIGLTGTPYVDYSINVALKSKIAIKQLQDTVYSYKLYDGLNLFLKYPEIKKDDAENETFIFRALDKYFSQYDITYENGCKSKIAFYCSNKKDLNENILPIIQKWYQLNNRHNFDTEVFKYYSKSKKKKQKDEKEIDKYKLHPNADNIYQELDTPYSRVKIVLLVAIGKEGWDCRSLNSVVIPRKCTSTDIFVLQTSCRCLREVKNAKEEKALIYLNGENYDILNNELRKTNTSIEQINGGKKNSEFKVPVMKRKNEVINLEYNDVLSNYKIAIKNNIKKELDENIFNKILNSENFRFNLNVEKATLGKKGLKNIQTEDMKNNYMIEYSISEFLYDLRRFNYYQIKESFFVEYKKKLENIYKDIILNLDWIIENPKLREDTFNPFSTIARYIFNDFNYEINFEEQIELKNKNIELLQWEPDSFITFDLNKEYNVIPSVSTTNMQKYERHPQRLEEDFIDEGIDPNDLSFNYIPHRFDSALEKDVLIEMLKSINNKDLHIFYNGYKNENLSNFEIQTPEGKYTPDFLVIKLDSSSKIQKILIIESKGEIYENEFQNKENFVKEKFLKYNPTFKFQKITTTEQMNNIINEILNL